MTDIINTMSKMGITVGGSRDGKREWFFSGRTLGWFSYREAVEITKRRADGDTWANAIHNGVRAASMALD